MFRRFLVCVLSVMSIPASAEAPAGSSHPTYAEVGLWGVSAMTTRPTCAALMAFEDIGLAIEYDAKNGTVELALKNTNATSVTDDQKVKLKIEYPASTGRNFDEILRAIDSLQLTAKHAVSTPVNWKQGEDVIISSSVNDEAAKQKYPNGWKAPKPYIRIVPQPQA